MKQALPPNLLVADVLIFDFLYVSYGHNLLLVISESKCPAADNIELCVEAFYFKDRPQSAFTTCCRNTSAAACNIEWLV